MRSSVYTGYMCFVCILKYRLYWLQCSIFNDGIVWNRRVHWFIQMYGCFCHDTWYWLSYPLNCSFQWRFIARRNLVCINYLTNSNKSHSFFVDHCVKFIVQENLNPMLQKAFLFKGQIQKAFVVPFPPLQRKCPYFSEFLRQNDFLVVGKLQEKCQNSRNI